MVTRKPSVLNWSNIVAYILMVIVNGLAGSTTLIGGKVTADISDKNFTLVTPAGYVFAIWGIIYLLLAIFAIYQILPRQRAMPFQKEVGWLFVLSSVFNITWLFAWQYEQLVISVVIMVLLLVSLIAIYLRLNIGRATVGLGIRVAVHLPFSVYLGWITIATIANISAMLVSIDWDGFGIGPETWAVVIIAIADVIALLVVLTRKDIAYELVIIWAFVGIAVNQSAHPPVVIMSAASAAFIAIATAAIIGYGRIRPKRRSTYKDLSTKR